MDARISEILGLLALFALASASAPGANCFEPVYCRGGTSAICFEQCTSLSEHIFAQNPDVSVTHPDCLVRCDSACSQVCGDPAVEAEPPDEVAPEDTKATLSSRPRRAPLFLPH